jgi:hypothetical protein
MASGVPGERGVVGGAHFSSRRGSILAGVVLLHAGLVSVVVVALRGATERRRPADFVSALILLPASPAASAQTYREDPVAPTAAAPITLPSMSAPPGLDGTVDWSGAARAAASAAAAPVRAFGRNPAVAAGSVAGSSGSAHTPGEQYRDVAGASVVWVNERCYVVADQRPLGMPDVLARAALTRTVCPGEAGEWRDLFKDLPAYENYHTLPVPGTEVQANRKFP